MPAGSWLASQYEERKCLPKIDGLMNKAGLFFKGYHIDHKKFGDILIVFCRHSTCKTIVPPKVYVKDFLQFPHLYYNMVE